MNIEPNIRFSESGGMLSCCFIWKKPSIHNAGVGGSSPPIATTSLSLPQIKNVCPETG